MVKRPLKTRRSRVFTQPGPEADIGCAMHCSADETVSKMTKKMTNYTITVPAQKPPSVLVRETLINSAAPVPAGAAT